jgi:phosphoribosylanthranilate isomerase
MDFVLLPREGSVDTIDHMVEALVPDRLQIGHVEDPALMAALRDRYQRSIRLAQVIHVSDETKATDIDPFLDEVDYIQIDSEGPLPGGNGIMPDLDISRAIADRAHEAGKLVIFSGGLTAGLVPVVLERVQPDGLDAEGANRSEFGVYNQRMMREFVNAAV